jgi:hypothetical protein
MVNKLAFQPLVDANVRECTFFVQVLQNTWGPPQKNFEVEYNLACRLKSDSDALMEGVSLFFKRADGLAVEPGILQLRSSAQSRQDCTAHEFAIFEFASLDEYKEQLRAQLSAWLRTVKA